MHARRAVNVLRRLFGVFGWPVRAPLRSRPEFSRVNAEARSIPVQPELSGLALRRARVPAAALRLLITLGYRWRPSADYQRRQAEMAAMNPKLRGRRRLPIPPPFLAYDDEADLMPVRLQPLPGKREDEEIRDLSDLEEADRHRRSRVLRPAIPVLDPEALIAYRPLLPRRYRDFLRYSPYPRIAGVLCALLFAAGAFVFISRLERADAAAAAQLNVAQHAFSVQLRAARAFGLGAKDMRELMAQARVLRTESPPGFPGTHARLRYYADQEGRYRALVRLVRVMERRELAAWTVREGVAYAELLIATRQAAALGLDLPGPTVRGCTTVACYRRVVAQQEARRLWIENRIHRANG
ncbi:MAG TPA: hypothetical protein VFB58_00500 [Chloroflexota bacterium]|nr:hypothetical protein [Chloroflexota bacterium]